MSVKAAGVGHFQIPTAPAALTAVAQSASANTLGSAVSFGNAPSALYITGVHIGVATTQVPTYVQIQILVTASIVASVLVPYGTSAAAAGSVLTGFRPIFPPIPVANAAAITVKSASSVASAVAWGVSLECIAQSNVVDDAIPVTTVTTVTNQLTAAAIATGVWQDAVAGDFTTASSIGKSLYVANVAPGGSGGLMISGSNSGTTTLGALTVTGATTLTGNVALADGLTIAAPSTLNRAGLDIAGNGTGAAIKAVAGATGIGFSIAGGATSGDGFKITTTSGHGINLAPVGVSMHGLLATGGNGGTSDGIKAVAGTGGVDLRAAISGNVTGSLSGSVGSVTGAVGSVTGAVASVTGAVGSVTGAVGSVTGNVGGSVASVVGAVGSVTAGVTLAASQHVIVDSGTVTTLSNLPAIPANWITAAGITAAALNGKGDWNIGKTGYSLVAGYDPAKTAAQAGDAMALTSGERTTLAAAIWNALTSGMTTVGSLGKKLSDWVIGTAQTGDAFALLGTPAGASVSADIAAVKADTAAVKTQTDQLAFTVAGQADVNLKSVAGTAVAGSGTEVSPWGPA